MASKKPYKKPSPQVQPEAQVQTAATVATPSSWMSRSYVPYIIILLFSTGIYFNSLWDKYAIDDTLVLTDNKFTLQGFGGIHDIMTKDAFVGFFGERGSSLVSGGRYRPLSMVTLAIEVQFFGLNPFISHLVNIILFTLTCLLLYRILSDILPKRKNTAFYLTIPFIATMLYAGHPIHTEAVTNIKGRDEIMGMLFSLLALFAAIRYVKTNNFFHALWGMLVFFLALLSKENAITFLAIIPLTFYFFTKAKPQQYAVVILYIISAGVFLYMRKIYTNSGLTAESIEILNNPFAYIPNTTDGFLMRYATIIYSFLLYFKLLIFPHPLSHDYYYNQIPYVKLSDPGFILSLLINAGLLGYAIYGFFKKSIPAYAILFYFITFSVVSNLLFTVGIIMNERFVFMCSLGFCLLIAYLLVQAKDKYKVSPNIITGILIAVLALYSIKTIARNMAWHDNLTLFITDSKVSTRSAKVQMSAGGDLDKLADENFDTLRSNGRLQHIVNLLDIDERVNDLPDSVLKKQLRLKAIEYIDTSLAIYPTHSNAWVLLGNASYKLNKNASEALADYEKAARYRVGGYYDAWYNMGCVEIENGMPEQAKRDFLKALAIDPEVFAARYNLAEAYYKLNMPDSAIYWYKKTLELKPLDGNSYYKIGTVYGKLMNNLDLAIVNISKAIECDPKIPLYYEDLGVAYGLAHRFDDAIAISNKCLERFPKYVPAYMNLGVSYRNKGDNKTADGYFLKAQQLRVSGQ
jgi:tetratricopeptide (TPR) repeat protein